MDDDGHLEFYILTTLCGCCSNMHSSKNFDDYLWLLKEKKEISTVGWHEDINKSRQLSGIYNSQNVAHSSLIVFKASLEERQKMDIDELIENLMPIKTICALKNPFLCDKLESPPILRFFCIT
uniref:Uncharacterized protein n=1 Tax=Glossina austeni TaxID=7395 RepID=A0A1A9USC7_GLOAU